jgi:hypothetical protein
MAAEKLGSNETASFEELLMSNAIEQEALVNLLERKGIPKKTELLEEIKRLMEGKKKFSLLYLDRGEPL